MNPGLRSFSIICVDVDVGSALQFNSKLFHGSVSLITTVVRGRFGTDDPLTLWKLIAEWLAVIAQEPPSEESTGS